MWANEFRLCQGSVEPAAWLRPDAVGEAARELVTIIGAAMYVARPS
jgi:hypothetical protein